MKRPILGFLAAAILAFGFVGTAPAEAATPDSPTAIAAPAHGDDHDGHKYSHPHGRGHPSRHHDRHFHDDDHDRDHDHDDHDDDRDRDRRRRCSGLIVICLR